MSDYPKAFTKEQQEGLTDLLRKINKEFRLAKGRHPWMSISTDMDVLCRSMGSAVAVMTKDLPPGQKKVFCEQVGNVVFNYTISAAAFIAETQDTANAMEAGLKEAVPGTEH